VVFYMGLENQVVVITGASKGLGKAIALKFAKEGARLALCARNGDLLAEVKAEAEALGASVLAVVADVSQPKDMERFVSMTEKTYGTIDIVINNASILGPSPMPLLLDYPEADFEEVLRVNTLSPFLITRRVLPIMLQKNKGRIINVTSEAGNVGYEGWGAYGISKFAVEGLTETWADELKETPIRVNMVDPGEMATEMHALAVPDCDYELGDPNEVANVFLFLASVEAAHLHGKRISAEAFLEKGVIE
jgi:NAD(P)-dependent dehydrogenase (short-subunit alcohol dehydrogenase family)